MDTPVLATLSDLNQDASKPVRCIGGMVVLMMLVVTLLPFAAPIFMHLGWEGLARPLYAFYGLTCHQLPQRSWFLFGPKLTYTLNEIRAAMPAAGATELREFVGTPALGWKVAWSDRMLSFYTMTAIWSSLYWLLHVAGVRIKPLHWRMAVLAVVPLVLDGATHLVNDVIYGQSGAGFRDSNAWLQLLTNNTWSAFYAGDQLGTFNWWARLATGVLAAWALAFAIFPRFDALLDGDRAFTANSHKDRK